MKDKQVKIRSAIRRDKAEHEATGSQHLIDMYTPFFPM